ncbi:glycosyltransferase [Flavobacterium sediminilitoris]|uniref:Glycosyltransferase n=1 Tax=Flavobacterium sediminilitoris TaxID=2024526 RepID=A0ABY4HLV7_9FLAO|nr:MULTISPECIES: glycosyltransferase [Flavobacterium]UOX33670.1 glycosyltransferase [Flavobacterium sediminilitoris]
MDKDKNDKVINEKNNTILSIVCHSYNHENYISETIESFLNQKTDFPFEIVIHDDASTDRTPLIIKEYQEKYPQIIKAIFQSDNKYSKNINIWAEYTFPKCKGKYIALCEGDDYWSDEYKLQKQVDFLENNSNYVVCWTDYLNFNGTNYRENKFNFKLDVTTIDFDNLFNPYCTLTLTVVFKKDALDMSILSRLEYFKDNSLYMILLNKGDGAFLNFKSSVYRIHEGGVYSMKSLYFQRYSSWLNINEMYNIVTKSKTKNIEKTLKTLKRSAAFEALKMKYNGGNIDQNQEKLINSFFSNASLSVKFKYYKRIFQYRFLNKKG